MITTAGEIYFIGEKDLKTGETSDYYKIGIVREVEGRTSVNRLSEHQTGNARRLLIAATVNSQAVEAVETTLHRLHAKDRVNGEWFKFTDVQLASAVKKAIELAKEMESHVPEYAKSVKLVEKVSNGQTIPATEEAILQYGKYQDAKVAADACENAIGQYKGLLTEAIASGADVSDRATVQKRQGALRFNEKLFESKYPDLYKQYSNSKTSISGRFTVAKAKSWPSTLDVVSPELDDLITDFTEMLEIDVIDEELEFQIHDRYLEIVAFHKYAEWEMEKAEIALRNLTGLNEGIEGLCTWKRTESTKVTLDKKSLKANEPEKYASCEERGAETESLIVETKAGYKS